MNDPYILAASILRGVAVVLAAAGILGGLWLAIRDGLHAQRQADQHDRDRQPIQRPLASSETFHARDFREQFTRHHLKP